MVLEDKSPDETQTDGSLWICEFTTTMVEGERERDGGGHEGGGETDYINGTVQL